MSGLKDIYRQKSGREYKDVFKNESRKSGCGINPVQNLRHTGEKSKKTGRLPDLKIKFSKAEKPVIDTDNMETDESVAEDTGKERKIKTDALRAKLKIWLVCIGFIYVIFLIYGVTKTTYHYDDRGYSVPVEMSYSDIKKAEDFKVLTGYYDRCLELYKKVLDIDKKLAENPDSSQLIATEYEAVLDEIDKYLTQLNAVSVKSEFSLLKNMLYNWCANDIAIYLQNIAEALTINSQTKAEQAVSYRIQSKIDFDTITKNYCSVGNNLKGVDMSRYEEWSADEYYEKGK